MRYALTQTTAPAALPLTADQVKGHLRVDHGHEDALIRDYIAAATGLVETITRRQLVRATWCMSLDRFPRQSDAPHLPLRAARRILLPRPPVIEINSITYLDSAGESQTLTEGDDFIVDLDPESPAVEPAYAKSWPTAREQPGAVVIDYDAGYVTPGESGEAPEGSVPASIMQALRYLVSHQYEHREPVVVGTIQAELQMTVESMLAGERALHIEGAA